MHIPSSTLSSPSIQTIIMAISTPTSLPLPPPPPSPPLLPLLEQFNTIPHIKQIHARALRTLTHTHTNTHHLHFLYTRLVHHSSLSDTAYSLLLLLHPFLPSLPPNSFCFNSLIRSRPRDLPLSLSLFLRMLRARVPPDCHTFPFLLKSCAYSFALSVGVQLHAHALKLGLAADDVYVSNSLVHFYSSCRRLSSANAIFLRMPQRNLVSWNVIIDAHCVNGEYEAALSLFREMMLTELHSPDAYSLQSLICSCAGLGALSVGMWAHTYILRTGVVPAEDVLISNSLVDLYSKCGAAAMAGQVFCRMPEKDVASYNAMILGLAANGCVKEALDMFSRMSMDDGLKPNSITFVGVLRACKHGGMVRDGRRYFDAMANEFGIEPQLEHYGCMVDLLASAGLIDEALELVRDMRCKPDAVIWRSILDACWQHNAGVEFGETLVKLALESEDTASSGAYVLLSKIYASANRWNDVGLVRGLMSDRGVKKEPGCSSIELDGGIVHEFTAADTSHPRSKDIYAKLDEIERELASVGYKQESSRSDSTLLHSERLAIALGLLDPAKGRPIRILKNLRVCRDCHDMTKLVSSVYGVEIVVRDRTRFHHFRDGCCSCSDYW